MRKAWKIILYIALAILILGELVLGVGLLSGGSPERVWDTVYAYYDGDAIIETWNSDEVQSALDPVEQAFGIEFPTIEVVQETPEPTVTPKPTPTPTPTPKPTATPAPSAEPTATANP